ncbi:MAG TPA: Do family serine endopeptidase [Noviherbaspirillum sp.]|nr:Do family serine endopeptidase [Noviherbaspirillum sp.]
MFSKHRPRWWITAIIIAVFLIACSKNEKEGSTPATGTTTQPTPQPQSQSAAPPIQLPSFVNLVKQQGPAVANISATRSMPESRSGPQLRQGDPFFEFFRRFGQPPQLGEAPVRSLGSGFIISQDGFILTNAHVIADTDEVVVKLTNKREYPAKVVGADTYTDVALLKIDASGLPVVTIGNPAMLEPGEWVAAIGAPFGFENSVTVGVVSAKGRMLPDESYVPFIQTDVAVNPGNSGGPLFSTRGEVIGINSQIYSETGGYMGISFAIPIDIAMGIAKQLRENGKVTRGRIGVQVQELTLDLATALGLKEARGALVAAVEKGGPADKAGIRPGDVILALDGKAIETSADLARFIASTKPGATVGGQVWRRGETVQIKVTVDELKR